ncbi:MAG: hypothetical protein F4230_11705 [Holophagales bacterium]|nr:hypothetical protein [Holophagales bacterium]
MLTKHSFGVYSAEEPDRPYRHEDLTAEVHALPKREAVADYAGPAEIESYTVMFGGGSAKSTSYRSTYGEREAPSFEPTVAHAACRLPDGRRSWANVEDRDTLRDMCAQEFCGRPVQIDGTGGAVCQ